MGILIELMRDIFGSSNCDAVEMQPSVDLPGLKRVLNVGGGSKATPISGYFEGWRHDLLDIDPRGEPDLVCDARQLSSLRSNLYDAVYCSHNLEHYYRHEGLKVLQGFVHILKEDGFAEVRVPDIAAVIGEVQAKGLDLDDVLYQSAAGPISAHDVIYGLQSEIVQSGQDFYSHKTGFTHQSLPRMLISSGFSTVYIRSGEHLGIHALAFKSYPKEWQMKLLSADWDLDKDIVS